MAESKYFLTICIPSYNRPEGLKRALESVDAEKYAGELQILVCEDCAPKRLEVRAVAEDFKATTKYAFKYVENEVNLGHGKNWRHCAHEAEGEYLMYIGDDDMVAPKALDPFMEWLHQHDDLGYVCRSYQTLNPDGTITYNKYYNSDRFYEPGIEAYTAFFMKSNLMTGYTIKREYTYDFEDSSVDYTLYYQMYLMGEVCLRYKSGYCNIPVGQYVGDGVSYFGVNECEKAYYKQGVNVATEFANVNMFFVVTELIDQKNNIESTSIIKKDFAKYSAYATMHKYRCYGIAELKESRRLLIKYGLSNSKYFNLYYYALLFLGPKVCQSTINLIKKVHGGRPEL
ncbi:MAG: glycosyltransferase family 2 protein [Bacteroidales bacterium]|nr:glycosyltransferase family 2 protein [Bacteroidales bacterium]